jgi:phage tail-like protein
MHQPLVGYHFVVEWGGTRGGFTEVSGLDVETEMLEYREGSDRGYAPRKFPGIRRYSNVVLKRGIFQGDNEFFQWLNATRLAAPEARDLTIALLNEEHEPTVIWKLLRAWPVKLVGPKLNALNSSFAIEALELAHDGLTIEHS